MKKTIVAALAAATLAGQLGAAEPLVHEAEFSVPVSELWDAWATEEGQKSWHAPHVEIDLRVGGLIRTNYDSSSSLDAPTTIVNEILAYEPERMLAMRVHTPPEGFPFEQAAERAWSVLYFEPMGTESSRLRVVGLGYDDTEQSKAMRAFFERGNDIVISRMKSALEGDDMSQNGESQTIRLFANHVGPWFVIDRERPNGSKFRVAERWRPGPGAGSWSYEAWMGNEESLRLHQVGVLTATPEGEIEFAMSNDQGEWITGVTWSEDGMVHWPWNIRARDGSVEEMKAVTRVNDEGRLEFQLFRGDSRVVNLLSEGVNARPDWNFAGDGETRTE